MSQSLWVLLVCSSISIVSSVVALILRAFNVGSFTWTTLTIWLLSSALIMVMSLFIASMYAFTRAVAQIVRR